MMKKFFTIVLAALSFNTYAQNSNDTPAGYYDGTEGLTCAGLKTKLFQIINNGFIIQPDNLLWVQFQVTDIKPRETGTGSANVIWDIYSDNPTGADPYNFDPVLNKCGNYSGEGDCFNKEHTVPKSWSNDAPVPAGDYHHIFPTDGWVNSKRANYVYGEVSTATYTSQNGSMLGSSAVAGIAGPVFEPLDAYKGDVARAFFYFVTQYQNDIPSWSSNTQAFDNSTYPSININYLQMMLAWDILDPVSPKEISRNEGGYSYQNNRNPYIDHPEFVNNVWNGDCPGLGVLAVNDVVYLTGKLSDGLVKLNWVLLDENNIKSYAVEKSYNGISYFSLSEIAANNSKNYTYNDNITADGGRRIYYRIKTVQKDGSLAYSAVFSLHVPSNAVLSIFPNPSSSGFVSIKMNINTALGKIAVYNLQGKMMLNQNITFTDNLYKLNISFLQSGTYMVKVWVNEKMYMQKLVVMK